jgi:hypothetical protein
VSEAFRESLSIRDDDDILRLPRRPEGTGRSDTTQPMWALLAPVATGVEGAGDRREPEIVVCDLEGPGAPWRDRLRAAIDRVPPGGALGVSGNRAIPTALLGALSRARWRRVTAPPPRRVEGALSEAGLRVTGRYRVWPSSQDPRIAWSGSHAAGWMQRSGVLGGGGERILGRAAARSRLVTPLVTFLAPGYAVVATRPMVESRWTD